jgi:hypothetical protein
LSHTPGLWKHISKSVQITFIGDDFGIKYTGKENLIHLIVALKKHHEVTLDEKGSIYFGITLEWDYNK